MSTKSMLLAAVLAVVAGLGAGFSAPAGALGPLECYADCRDVRYECYTQCGAGHQQSQCRIACESNFQSCRANCG